MGQPIIRQAGGYSIPQKRADELRGLEVEIGPDRIIDSIEFLEIDLRE